MKAKRAYVCNECGADFPRWQGQCNACGSWNSISEVRLAASPQVARNERLVGYAGALKRKYKLWLILIYKKCLDSPVALKN